MEFAYKRVSTVDQNLDRQLHGMTFDREYVEKVSAKDMNRPQLQALLQNIRPEDIVYVHEMSRLARNTKDLLEIVERIVSSGGCIKFKKENLTFDGSKTDDPFQTLMLTMLGAISTFERDLLLSRQREGIHLAKLKGKYKGRQSRFTDEDISNIQVEFKKSKNKSELSRKWGISRQYLYSLASVS